MTDNHSFTVEWKPNEEGDEGLNITLNCTGEELWEGITALLISFIEEAGLSEKAAANAVFGALHYAKKYLDHTIGGH